MKNHEGFGEYRIPELKVEGEVYNELQQDKKLNELSDSLDKMARAAEQAGGERTVEKSWAEEMAEVEEFDAEKAAVAAENDRLAPEEFEQGTTRKFEAEIMALNTFEKNTDFLNEPIEEPTETDIVRDWAEKGHLDISSNAEAVQDWLHSKDLSPDDDEYRKTLIKNGMVKKKLFYRPDEAVAKFWSDEKEERVTKLRNKMANEFVDKQDDIERKLEGKVHEYDFYADKSGEPMSKKAELVHKWLEDSGENSSEHSNMIIEWLNSDEGSDREKRYRALVRARVSGTFTRIGDIDRSKYYGPNGEDMTRSMPDLKERPVECMQLRTSIDFANKLRGGVVDDKYANLSESEKEERWEQEEKRYLGTKDEKAKKHEDSRNEAAKERKDKSHNEKDELATLEEERRRKEDKEKQRKKAEEEEEWRKRAQETYSDTTPDYMDPFGMGMAS